MSAHDDNPPGAGIGPAHLDAAEPRRLLDDPQVGDGNGDGAGGDPWALGLLRAAEPYRAPAGRKQRVQLRLGHVRRRRAPLLLRFAVMAFVLFGFAAIVSAAFGHWPAWVARAYDRVAGKPPGPRATAPVRARVARHDPPPAAGDNPTADDAPAPSAAPEAIDPIAPPAERRAPRDRVAAPHARRAVVPPQPAQLVAEDASAVSAAMRALRVDRDPARARSLLARYLADHPNGALAEEALAMSIEAAVAHHDADVAALAGRYLRLYPQGSFQGLARQALGAP